MNGSLESDLLASVDVDAQSSTWFLSRAVISRRISGGFHRARTRDVLGIFRVDGCFPGNVEINLVGLLFEWFAVSFIITIPLEQFMASMCIFIIFFRSRKFVCTGVLSQLLVVDDNVRV